MSTTFSYAQAAKGLSSTGPSSTVPSKTSTGANTPSKDPNSTPPIAPMASAPAWADDTEVEQTRNEKQLTTRENRTFTAIASAKQSNSQNPATASGVSSPDLGASSASTIVKDDDASSLQNASSESTSTWENKSQASTSVEKSAEPVEKTSEKIKKGKNAEKTSFKPLQEAPIPVVNPWARRAEDMKTKTAKKASISKQAVTSLSNGTPQSPPASAKKTKGTPSGDGAESDKKIPATEIRPKGRDDDKTAPIRKDVKADADADRSKKSLRNRPQEKDSKTNSSVLPPPPERDQESWPTPESAVIEDRKKAPVKSEKTETERKENTSGRSHGKQEWINVPITPSVIFNTPLPSTASSRRGGRGGGRGGAQNGGRGNGVSVNGAGNSEKDSTISSGLPNGDNSKRGRPDAAATRDTSPKDARAASASSNTAKDTNGEKTSKPTTTPEAETASRRSSVMTEQAAGQQAGNQNNAFARQYPTGRPNKGRRGDFVPQGDRRKDGDQGSPTKEAPGSHDRRTSTATQTDAIDEGERRASSFQEGQFDQSKQGSFDRRTYGSFSARGERGRGGSRGGRGAYQNGGHQFTNGHQPSLQNSSTFPVRSPTTFNPDQATYFTNTPQNGRSFRNGHRSPPVSTDNMYGRMSGFPGAPPQMHPLQTFVPNMYDYPMMGPMSAVPFGPYGVDQGTLFNMVSTQLEYYFSVENLCKDIFLRKHMDSKGFVYLSVIAEFNRIKQLTTDLELLRFVCYQSPTIEFRVGVDGKDRLRRAEGWEQWVLGMPERDPSAQHDGLVELHNPPVPHPNGFDQLPPYSTMSATSPNGQAPFSVMNGVHPGGHQDSPVVSSDKISDGPTTNGVNGFAGSNGHVIEPSTKAVSAEPDSFSDEQVETLTVIVRKQDSQVPTLLPSTSRTFSNGSIDSKSGVPDESEKMSCRHSTPDVNGTGPTQGFEPDAGPERASSPSKPVSSPALSPVRLYWVKGKDAPVKSLPLDSSYEHYLDLRFKALEQRQLAPTGTCPYDTDVLYQFWSHFLIRNFNLRMYQEFYALAFEDSAHRDSDVGLTNLIKYYGESLVSSQSPIRERVACDYIELVKSEHDTNRPAFKQLQSALRNGTMDPTNRKRIGEFLDVELRESLE